MTQNEILQAHLHMNRSKAELREHLVDGHGTIYPTRAQLMRLKWDELIRMHQLDHEPMPARLS